MYILAIDTSCDDTSAAVSQDRMLSNIISSQVELHSEFGGVMPDVARRGRHHARGDSKAVKQAGVMPEQIDVFARRRAPDWRLRWALASIRQKISVQYGKSLIGINHMEGHYSNFVESGRADSTFPLLALLVSGGHTELVMKDHGRYQLQVKLDDAAGEAFDKVARMLGLGYPGGAVLAQMAEEGDENAYKLPVPLTLQKGLDFSFSGLKTAVVRLVSEITSQGARSLTKKEVQILRKQRVTVALLVIKQCELLNRLVFSKCCWVVCQQVA
jgi:N6-L-threonylcarbamoyladenine synthase